MSEFYVVSAAFHRCQMISPVYEIVMRVVSCEQLLMVDGVQFRSAPAQVIDGIQKFLGVTPYYNYTQALMYDLLYYYLTLFNLL